MERKPSFIIAFCLCSYLLFFSCAAPARQVPPPDPGTLYKKAASLDKTGKTKDACDAYTLLWKTYPGNELAPKALYRAANIASTSNTGASADLYASFLKSYPNSPLQAEVRQKLMTEQIKLGKYADAYDLFMNTYAKKPDPKMVQPGIRIAQAMAGSDKPERVMDITCMVFPHADKASQEVLLPLWKAAVQKTDDGDVLAGYEKKVSDSRLREPLIAQEAEFYEEQAEDEGDTDTASFFGKAKAFFSNPEEPKRTIGVLLPLSGKYEPIGQKVLKGIQLASKIFSGDTSPQVEYIIRDYGDSEQAIPNIIAELDTKDRVIALIGPIGESAGSLACRETQKRAIPSLVFTRAEGSYPEALCFSNFVSVDVQVETLLKTAASRNITRFAVLLPKDNFGKVFTNTFVRKARDMGIKVVRQVEYSPAMGDIKGAVQKLVKGIPRANIGKPNATGPAFQGLLIPDSASNAGMIASYLPYLNVRGATLFGPALWDTPELVKVGGRSVEDAIFVSGFYAGSERNNVQGFTEKFYSTFGYKPSIWEATAYDSANILQDLTAHTPLSRKDVQERISSLQGYPGLTGETSFNKNGTVNKSIYVLTVKNGAIVEVIP